MPEIDERDDHRPRHSAEPAESRTGIARFLGLNLGVWAIVVVLSLVFLAIILAFAL